MILAAGQKRLFIQIEVATSSLLLKRALGSRTISGITLVYQLQHTIHHHYHPHPHHVLHVVIYAVFRIYSHLF